MMSKLPRWVGAGAWVLAFVAGMVNVVGLLSFEHQAVTHLTGTTTLLGEAVAQGLWGRAWHHLAVIGSFLVGAALSGVIIQDSTLKLGRRYGVALLIECLLLCGAVPLLRAHWATGAYLATCACGLQNAMASTYSGSALRTTHLSGMFTDLGIFLGHGLRGIAVDGRRFWISVITITAFLSGSVAGAAAFHQWEYGALYFPASITGLAALAYAFYRVRRF